MYRNGIMASLCSTAIRQVIGFTSKTERPAVTSPSVQTGISRADCVALLLSPLIAANAATAHADTIGDGLAFRNNPRMIEHLRKFQAETLSKLGSEQDKALGLMQDCVTGHQVRVIEVYIAQPIDFPEDRVHPVKGVWRIGYDMSRCNETKRYNAFFIANPNDTPPTSRAYYPGVSLANPQLIHDTVRTALTSALVQAKVPESCKNIGVLDMNVAANPDASRGGNWKESWTFKMCDKLATVGIDFIPDQDGKGTSFRISIPSGGRNADGPDKPQ
jgi:hypothetical protein